MNNRMNTILVLLTVTAAILGAILIGSYTAGPAYAEISMKQGDYIVGNMSFTNKRDLIYVIDIAARKLNVYALNTRNGSIDLLEPKPIDLDLVFGKSR